MDGNLTDLIERHHRAMLDDPHPDGTAMHAKLLALLTARQAKQHASGTQTGASPLADRFRMTPDQTGPPPGSLPLPLPPGPHLAPDGGLDSLVGLLNRPASHMDYGEPLASLYGALGRG